MATSKLTEPFVIALPYPEAGQVFYFDTSLRGFGLRVSQQTKSFFAEKRIAGSGRTRRITIGAYPAFKVAEARKEAEKIIGELAKGYDRKAAQRESRIKAATLQDVLDLFMTQRQIKASTADQYRSTFESSFHDWANLPWVSITTARVKVRHIELTNSRGPGLANYAMRILSALLNFARATYRTRDDEPLVIENAVSVLGRTQGWNKLSPRITYVKHADLHAWWAAVGKLKNQFVADLFRTLILTGLRFSEAATLLKENVDLASGTLTVEETKNGLRHTLPLSDYLIELLRVRMSKSSGPYVFQGTRGAAHVAVVDSHVAKVVKETGIKFSCHALRRSFAVYAESLDVSAYALKRLLNHKASGDVTFTHYLPLDVERLRQPMQKICDFVLKNAGVKETAEIVKLSQKAA